MNINFCKNKRNTPTRVLSVVKGFTLVETLVAISILLVGVSAAFSAAQSGLSATNAVKDRITAIFLAQESMEMVRNLRDRNILEQNSLGPNDPPIDWLSGLSASNQDPCFGQSCDYDFREDGELQFTSCVDGYSNNCTLFLDAGRYFQDENVRIIDEGGIDMAPVPSKFTRSISIVEIGVDPRKEARVTVTVSWPDRFLGTNYFHITENISNWFEL